MRGLWERRTPALVVLVIAIVPVASAVVGPLYADASRTTIVRTVLSRAPVEAKGWRYTVKGDRDIRRELAAFTAGARFLTEPVFGMEVDSPIVHSDVIVPLMWQEGQCEHVRIVRGRCPSAAREIMVSEDAGYRVGARVALTSVVASSPGDTGYKPVPLRVVGLYRPVSAADPFWFGRSLFAAEAQGTDKRAEPFFTARETRDAVVITGVLYAGDQAPGWADYGIVYVDPARMTGSDVQRLAAMQATAVDMGQQSGVAVFSWIDGPLRDIGRQTGTLAVPTYLVIGQLVGLGWLLLFQTVGDLVRARSPETALARLRGYGRLRVWLFMLTEPLVLLAAAYPLGVLAGRAAGEAIVAALLPGVPVGLTPGAALAGAAALAGGLPAAVVAAWRTARRPVTEEWRRTPRRARQSWVVDAVVLAVAGLGLLELLGTGVITDASAQRTGALAVPALIALALALLARRLLPPLVRLLFGLTRRRGGLGPFLALRQVARGPVAAGSVIVLGTAFGLATFAVCAWTATIGNYAETARFHLGAPGAIEVGPVSPRRLAEAVRAADPAGGAAAPVVRVPGTVSMIATDPARLARVGHWRPDRAGGVRLADATSRLSGPDLPRVPLSGDRIRLRISHEPVPEGWQVRLFAVVRVPGRVGPAQLAVARLAGTGGAHAWPLPPECAKEPCELRSIRTEVHAPQSPDEDPFAIPTIHPTVKAVEVRSGGRWRPVDAALTDRRRWEGDGHAGPDGLSMPVGPLVAGGMRLVLTPAKIPAIQLGPVGDREMPGLDRLHAARTAAVARTTAAPGLSDTGVIVDLEQADRVSFGVAEEARFEVWTAAGKAAAVADALRAQGLTVVSIRHVADLEARFAGEGPGLALLLLLASAIAAAALALGRTVLALYTAARRRRHELAALEASGARRGALRAALLLEQVVTVCAGLLTGLAAGLLAARAALERIPQFAEPPASPPLPFEVAPAAVALLAGVTALVSLLATAVVSEVLLRGVRVEELRA
ncbi:FtsX-like permease family protein [Thermoactinospora rubra]|uniref:FtsX-like permease family protein n=1 Tax=Thermoactinospora rubra TaxID=1088767 RepID=UPI001F0ADD9B|nr:FtsX-like permease family protein [Thermoactinospora rubra]